MITCLYKCLFLFTLTNSAGTKTRQTNLRETCNRKILSIMFEPQNSVHNHKKKIKHRKEALKKSLPYDSDVLRSTILLKYTSAAVIEIK